MLVRYTRPCGVGSEECKCSGCVRSRCQSVDLGFNFWKYQLFFDTMALGLQGRCRAVSCLPLTSNQSTLESCLQAEATLMAVCCELASQYFTAQLTFQRRDDLWLSNEIRGCEEYFDSLSCQPREDYSGLPWRAHVSRDNVVGRRWIYKVHYV
jgi:hypothetical protein